MRSSSGDSLQSQKLSIFEQPLLELVDSTWPTCFISSGWIFPNPHFSRMFDDLTKRWTNGNSRLRFGRMVKHELTQARAAFWQVAKTQLNKRDTTCCYLDTIRVIWAEV
ncbi:EGF and pentraxin domain-containing protein, von Willebrand factor type A,Sushi [Trichinella spiralis]|uniref:EGF and pentraxin domain-containing protein, von Willebrand factor type A,Sushi n=1 Tax=Trichinella spiralis TaxID=6334 RepID=A0ABR3K5E6_TRISP